MQETPARIQTSDHIDVVERIDLATNGIDGAIQPALERADQMLPSLGRVNGTQTRRHIHGEDNPSPLLTTADF